MLNSDISLAYNASIDSGFQSSADQICGNTAIEGNSYGCSEPKSTYRPLVAEIVDLYANDNSLFLKEFGIAFTKMVGTYILTHFFSSKYISKLIMI